MNNSWHLAYLCGDDVVIVSNGSAFVGAYYDWEGKPKVDFKGAAPDIMFFQTWNEVQPAEDGQVTDRQRKLADFAIAEIQKDPVYVQAISDMRLEEAKRWGKTEKSLYGVGDGSAHK